MTVDRMAAHRAAELGAAEPTYPEVGATRAATLPAGYRTFRRTARIGSGAAFASLRRDLLRWAVQSRSGIKVSASGDVAPGVVVDLRIGVGLFSVTAPCRVVDVIDEPRRCGFAYGTLPGHPESGEESFLIERPAPAEDEQLANAVTFTITAFSRPATHLTRLAGPLGHRVQDVLTHRYLRALG